LTSTARAHPHAARRSVTRCTNRLYAAKRLV